MQTASAVGAVTSIITAPLGAFSVILGTVAGFATSVATEICYTKPQIFESLATNMDGRENWRIFIKYKYDRHGSNDGAWTLQNVYLA